MDADVADAKVPELEVLFDADSVASLLDPVRSRILALLSVPGSATTLGLALGLARQKVNYHLRMLESHGLVRLVEERSRRGLTERVMVATAKAYVVAPSALGANALETNLPPSVSTDRLSSRYLVAIAARIVQEVGELARRAERARQPLATLTIDTEIRFATAGDRAAFTAELTSTVHDLAARHHDEATPGGRWHRLVVAAHPMSAASADIAPITEETEP